VIEPRKAMPPALRATTYVVFTALWLSGCIWLLLHQLFAVQGEFGTLQNPWEPAVLLVHGIVAIIGLYILGWLSARHIAAVWDQSRRRVSGMALLTLLFVLSVSGFALFFLTNDEVRSWSGDVHEILGLVIIAFAIEHWFFGKQKQSS
jgi:hypothetical protein